MSKKTFSPHQPVAVEIEDPDQRHLDLTSGGREPGKGAPDGSQSSRIRQPRPHPHGATAVRRHESQERQRTSLPADHAPLERHR